MSDCLNCNEYDNENHFCPKWCDVIKSTIEDARADERVKTIEEVVCFISTHVYGYQDLRDFLEQIKGGAK